ncbi:MAG: mevalonate kinase [Candidatus Roizmanbacteria bacterium]|nr:mevalonate kinase [Candidatus Roizmanbacteria bacterium]
MERNNITVSAPGKLMLLGEHAVVYGHPCLVTAVDQRMKATVELVDSSTFELEAPDVKVHNYKKSLPELGKGEIPKGAQFVEIAIKNFKEKYPFKDGVRVATASEFSSQFGFGSSSASTVCVVKALSELTRKKLSNKELFDIAYKTVLDIQGKGSGFDIASAIWGGTLYFVTGGEKIEQLSVDNLPLVVGYSGIKADTVTLMDQVLRKAKETPEVVENSYREIHLLVEKVNVQLLKQNWKELGELMNENQKLLNMLGVSIPKLDDMIAASIRAGAYGAKLSGAGGGDCMIAIVSPNKEQEVKKAIGSVGGTIIPVSPNAPGARIEK